MQWVKGFAIAVTMLVIVPLVCYGFASLTGPVWTP